MIVEHPALRRGVLYIEDFDEPNISPVTRQEPATDIIAPCFSAEDLEAARQQAYAEGTRDGVESAARERTHTMRLLLENLVQQLQKSQSDITAHAEAIASELAQTLFSALYGSLPELCRVHGETEIRALVKRIMPGLARESRVDIRLHPDLVAAVEDEISRLPHDIPEKIELIADPHFAATDLRATWKTGHLQRSSAKIWQDLRQDLEIFQLLPVTPKAPHAE